MRLAAVALISVLIAAPALAQPPAPEPAASAPLSDEALAAKLAHDAELADQDRRSEALNVEINRRNRAVQAHNDATRAAYDKAVADYHAELAAQDAANRKVQADYAAKVEAWKADVAACKAGEARRCVPPTPAGKPAAP